MSHERSMDGACPPTPDGRSAAAMRARGRCLAHLRQRRHAQPVALPLPLASSFLAVFIGFLGSIIISDQDQPKAILTGEHTSTLNEAQDQNHWPEST